MRRGWGWKNRKARVIHDLLVSPRTIEAMTKKITQDILLQRRHRSIARVDIRGKRCVTAHHTVHTIQHADDGHEDAWDLVVFVDEVERVRHVAIAQMDHWHTRV